MAEQALSGVKVIDLTQEVAGPYCTKLLAGYGAEVIKVEPPDGGEPGRRLGPFVDDVPHLEKSLTFLHLNTNKLGVTLNLETATGKKIFKELVKDADIVVESFRPGVMASLGLGYETLKAIKPTLVMTSITDYGQTGPYKNYKATAITRYAGPGNMIYTGSADREPIKTYGRASEYLVGTAAIAPTLACLYLAQTDGIGQQVDFSTFDYMAGNIDRRGTNLINYAYSGGRFYYRTLERGGDMLTKMVYPCKDGYWASNIGWGYFERVCRMIERPDLVDDPRFATTDGRATLANREYIEAAVLNWCVDHTKAEIMKWMLDLRIAASAIYTPEDVFHDPHMQARGYFVEIDHPIAGKFPYPSAPFKMTECPWQDGPAPMLGQHNVDIYCGRLGYSKEDLVRLRERGII